MREDFTQDICPRPRCVLLVARGHVAWTHCAAHELGSAAVARSIALLCRPQVTSSFREIQLCLKLTHSLVGFVAKARIHWRGISDLTRSEDPIRIPRPF